MGTALLPFSHYQGAGRDACRTFARSLPMALATDCGSVDLVF